ncbi:MAG: HlyD family secretion protein [Methylobacterium sp.]|uniref:HlyD family secretion protein n=1 Tax=Methylobacterium sp. TaxID=409 RepID=UPI002584BC2E|nr:HlyD family secretion protein [Methylobacterium sp.]MBY0297436.1 HlyD family secretion protein [Methylobacterium sp.]
MSFPAGGILRRLDAKIGQTVGKVDRQILEDRLAAEMIAGKFSDQVFTSQDIKSIFNPHAIASLANASTAAAVDAAVARRQIFYKERYLNRERIRSALGFAYEGMEQSYKDLKGIDYDDAFQDNRLTHGKLKRQDLLMQLADMQRRKYIRVSRQTGSNAVNALITSTTVIPAATTTVRNKHVGSKTNGILSSQVDAQGNNLSDMYIAQQSTFPSQTHTTTSNLAEGIFPQGDIEIRYKEKMLELIDIFIADAIGAGRFDNFEDISNHEMGLLSSELRRVQLAYADTFLTAPFEGIITAVFKEEGESVQAGEPVMRIENDTSLLLLTSLRHNGAIRVGQSASIIADNLFGTKATAEIDCTVVSLRGHSADDGMWDMILSAENYPMGWKIKGTEHDENLKLPLNYHFDRENTKVILK